MGTNYYWIERPCPTCKHSDNKTHIGKSSLGWTFSFHETFDCKSWKDWRTLLLSGTGKIFDEYGDEVAPLKFIQLVESIKNEKNNQPANQYSKEDYLDDEGNSFSPREFS